MLISYIHAFQKSFTVTLTTTFFDQVCLSLHLSIGRYISGFTPLLIYPFVRFKINSDFLELRQRLVLLLKFSVQSDNKETIY